MNNLGVGAHNLPPVNPGSGVSEGTPSPRLVSAAHEFEAAMMKELLSPLQSDGGLTGGDGEDEGSPSAIGSFAAEAFGKAISEHGGFGIARSILHQLTSGDRHSGNQDVPKSPNGNTSKVTFK